MALNPKPLSEMIADAISYLAENTNISMLEPGSNARALVDSNMLEIARLQDFAVVSYDNRFLSRAKGPFLDIIGDDLGILRNQETRARIFKEDGAIRFYVRSGTLGSQLPDTADPTKGRIPRGTNISNADGSVQFVTTEDTIFPINQRSVFAGAEAISNGTGANVGPNQLTSHSLSNPNVYVTNDIAIATGSDLEDDDSYRFRISRAFSTRFSNNAASVHVAATSTPGVVQATVLPYSRGAGTFDVLLIPRGNKLPRSVREQARRLIESVTAFGVSPFIREPEYVPVRFTVRLRFSPGVTAGVKASLKDRAQSAILNYIGSIPLGGELVINQLRAAILSVSDEINDLTILEMCIDGKPMALRNYKLDPDELFTPDEDREAVIVI